MPSFSVTVIGGKKVQSAKAAFRSYSQWIRKNRNTILAQVANGFRRNIDYGFKSVMWKGNARAEHDARVAAKSGTAIRQHTVDRYSGNATYQRRGKFYYTGDNDLLALELARRTQGKRVLSVAWRLSAWKYAKSVPKINPKRATAVPKGKWSNRSREFGHLTSVQQGDGFVRFIGDGPGIGMVSDRYRIESKAVSSTQRRMVKRINEAAELGIKEQFPKRFK